MVLYFSGTGNSHYTAKIIAEKTGDQLVSINQLMKQGNKETLVSLEKPFVFVCPTYAWRIPRVVEEFIRESHFSGTDKAYFIVTCGDDTGNAVGYIQKLCKWKGFEFQGFAEIIMPENYIAMFKSPDEATAEEIIKKGALKAELIAETIRDGLPLPVFTTKAKLKSGIVNDAFYKIIVKPKGFHTTEKCIGCRKCVQLCPLNNIEMEDGKPRWNNHCTHCMACISGCPTTAIEYKKKTQGKTRYYLECK
jgi:ferredoxin